jgi:hypothetical protein
LFYIIVNQAADPHWPARHGYIPLWKDDPTYLAEVAREQAAGMPQCRCSNCDPAASDQVIKNLVWADQSNFDQILDGTFTTKEVYDLKHKYPQKSSTLKKRKFTEADNLEILDFSTRLVGDLHRHYNSIVSPKGAIDASYLFDEDDAKAILSCFDHIYSATDLRGVIGGDCFVGQCEWIFDWIIGFRLSPSSTVEGGSNIISVPKKKAKAGTSSSRAVIGLGAPPRAPTKKALAAEAARIKSIERQKAKEKKDLVDSSRRKQVAQIMWEAKQSHMSRGKQ